MAAEHSTEAPGQLAGMLRRRLRLLIVLAVLGTGLGIGAAFLVPTQFTATASVLVSPLEGNPYSPQGRGDDLINLETEAQLVQTDTVAKLAQQRLKGGDLATLRANVSVAVPPNTQVLNITYRASSASAAEAGTRAFADSYLQYRQQRAQAVLDGKLKKLTEQSQRVEANLRAATKRLATSVGTQRAFLTQRITAYTNQLGVIDEQANDINSTPVSPGQVINPASAPTGAAVQRFAVFGAAGLIGGLAAGLLLAFLRERLDQRLRTTEQIEALGLRVLSAIPAEAGRQHGTLALVDAPRSTSGEAYRRLRSGIVARIPATPISLLVSSATPGTTAASIGPNLAVALAYAGSDTILIDATADEPDPAGWFGLSSAKGLSDVLLLGSDPAALLIHADSQLRLLPRGDSPTAATHRFSGPRMRGAIETLQGRADFVLLSGPNVHDADAQALCTLVDMVVLVVHAGVTTREQLQMAHAEVVHAGAKVVGVVLEGAPRGGGARPPKAGAVAAPVRPVNPQRQPARQPEMEQPVRPASARSRDGRAAKAVTGAKPTDITVDLAAELADDTEASKPTAALPVIPEEPAPHAVPESGSGRFERGRPSPRFGSDRRRETDGRVEADRPVATGKKGQTPPTTQTRDDF